MAFFFWGDTVKKKLAVFLGAVILILALFLQIIVPQIAKGALTRKIIEAAKTEDVQLNISSAPNALISLGRLDHVAALAREAKLGDVYVSELTLDGEAVSIDMPTLINDSRVEVKSAKELRLKGIVSEENLRELISRKVDKLQNVHVDITDQRVYLTAEVKVFGKMADAEVQGVVLEDDGSLYFRMTHIDVKNALLGRLNLENFFGDILLVGSEKLPLKLKFSDVVMQNGHITVTAERKKGDS